MIKTIFFDRDGIINEVIPRDSYYHSPRELKDFHLRPEFYNLYRSLEPYHLTLLVVSNQPDIARGLLSLQTLEMMNAKMRAYFNFLDIRYCVHDDTDQCVCRKPKPGMVLDLMNLYGILPSESVMIGDSWKDMAAGKSAGLKTILLVTAYNQAESVVSDYRVKYLDKIMDLHLIGG